MKTTRNAPLISLLLLVLLMLLSQSTLSAENYRLELLKKIYSLGTAGISGTYYPLGNTMARLFSRGFESIVVVAEPTPGSIANIGYLQNQQIDLALVQSDVAWMSFHGQEIFAGNRFRDLRVLTSLYSEVIQIVVRRDSQISSLEDLKGKRISVGTRDSGSAASFMEVLKAAGLDPNDYEFVYERFTMATESLRDGYVDAVYYAGGVPAAGFQRLARRTPIRLLPIPEQVVKKLTKQFPYFSVETISAGAYPGHSNPVKTVGMRALLVSTQALPDAEARKMLQLIYENTSLIAAQSQSAISIRRNEAIKGVDPEMLHNAAKAYFAQTGLIKP